MRLHTECITCNIQQVNKILKNTKLSDTDKERLMSLVLRMLSQIDYRLCNPEVMKKTWDIICMYIKDKDPYLTIKQMYNLALLSIYEDIKAIVDGDNYAFVTAMKMATIANIIDFSANHGICIEEIQERLQQATKITFAIDHHKSLQAQLIKANTLIYIGDNCGEIVLDKIFIETICKQYACKVHYVVRETPIINDVTMVDASMVKMEEVATVISSGDDSLGLVWEHTSIAFQQLFNQADVIIAKGQGNFEGMHSVEKDGLFHLFMVKCEVMERIVGVKQGSIVCIKK